ncbi:MAG: MmgE/PrpD family protein [Pseudomonadota bacterium]
MLQKAASTEAAGTQTRLARIADICASIEVPEGTAADRVRSAGTDLMACVLAGASHPFSRKTRAALQTYQGTAPVFGAGVKLPAPFAALCNAIAGHAFEFDDWEEPGNTHPSVVMFPALWALAAERGASGGDLARAYATGFEVIVCLGKGLNYEHYNKGWHSTATLGVIGAAAACARLLRLLPEQTAHAMSLAITQASGYTCQFGSGAKPLQAGFPARDGLMAAQLAEQGMTGQPGALDGETGFAGLMASGDLAKLDRAIADCRGTALQDWGIVQKPYPSCGYTHRLVDCGRELSGRIDPSDIVQVRAELPDFHAAILPYDRPQTRSEALFSIPFCVATALLRGGLSLSDLEEEARCRPDLLALIEKVEVVPHAPARPQMNYDPEQPDRLTVILKNHDHQTASCAYPTGAPQNPMSDTDIRRKFETAAPKTPSRVLDALMRWDQANDINTVLEPFGDIR